MMDPAAVEEPAFELTRGGGVEASRQAETGWQSRTDCLRTGCFRYRLFVERRRFPAWSQPEDGLRGGGDPFVGQEQKPLKWGKASIRRLIPPLSEFNSIQFSLGLPRAALSSSTTSTTVQPRYDFDPD